MARMINPLRFLTKHSTRSHASVHHDVKPNKTKKEHNVRSINQCSLHQNIHPELGRVNFRHDSSSFGTAVEEAKESNKPMLILFDELPGCSTCIGFGRNVLSHPLLIEAIETLFVPVVVNNRGLTREDTRLLNQFDEPHLNNPVVRIVSPDSLKDIAPRVADGLWTIGAVSRAMLHALPKAPKYLELLHTEHRAKTGFGETAAKAVFAMPCFWIGERVFAALDGVIGTKAGWWRGDEVVEVVYDTSILTYSELIRHASKHQVASKIFYHNTEERDDAREALKIGSSRLFEWRNTNQIRSDRDPKHSLRQTSLRFVPLTALQSAKINLAVANHDAPEIFLSPRQRLILKKVETDPPSYESVDNAIVAAWKRLDSDKCFAP